MCSHKNLVYIGEQEVNGSGETVSLYNCIDCHTTLVLKKKDIQRKIAVSKKKIETD